ncbi:MAG: hypothetical protein JWO31_1200 [Phycisphaerales bacterium]|nr:hypothetical protein [Phycisphaerales bacterium]
MKAWIVTPFAWLWAWVRSWFIRRPRPLKTFYLEELPDKLDSKAVYVLGEGANHWFVSFLCPCGCGVPLQMTLLPEDRPHWRLTEHPEDRTVSLAPSVWRHAGCHSHFFLRRGQIDWA